MPAIRPCFYYTHVKLNIFPLLQSLTNSHKRKYITLILFHRKYIKEKKGLISLCRKQDINVFNPAAAFSYHVQYEKLCHKNEIKCIKAQATLPLSYFKVSTVLAGHNIDFQALSTLIYFPVSSSTYLCTFLGCSLERCFVIHL